MAQNSDRFAASLWEFSDTELLAVIYDLADENGWTSSMDVRLQLGENIEQVKWSGVPIRMGWLRRFGWLERNVDTGLYRLTAMGLALIEKSELTSAFSTALDRLNPAQRLHTLRIIGEFSHGSTNELRKAFIRQWRRSNGR